MGFYNTLPWNIWKFDLKIKEKHDEWQLFLTTPVGLEEKKSAKQLVLRSGKTLPNGSTCTIYVKNIIGIGHTVTISKLQIN